MTPSEHEELVVAKAMLLGFKCWPSEVDTSGYRWNSGSMLGRWCRSPYGGAIEYLNKVHGLHVYGDGSIRKPDKNSV